MSILWYNSSTIHGQRYRFVLDTVNPLGPKLKLQVRSRGRHEPGSGPYDNRIAFGGSVTGTGAWSDAYFSLLKLFEDDPSAEYRYHGTLIKWSGGMLTRVNILGPSQLIPATDNHWRIDWRTEYIDLSTLQPSGRYYYSYREYYTDTYRLNAYYGDFSDSKTGAMRAAYSVVEDYTFKGKFPRAYQYSNTRSNIYDDPGLRNTEGPRLSPRFATLDDVVKEGYNGHIEAGFANAYVDACSKLPHTAGMNNIANIMQTISSIKKFLSGQLDGLGSLSDAWLGWRYEYSTTKLDIEEGAALVNRLREIVKSGVKTLRSNGYYKSGDYVFRCAIQTDAGYLGEIQSFAEKWGIQLSGYNIWDMIPYSFIVDWFLDVGGLLERWESQQYAMKIRPTSCWYSVQVQGTNEFGCYEIDYHRFPGAPKVAAADLDWVSSGPSGVTVVKRAADVICLLF